MVRKLNYGGVFMLEWSAVREDNRADLTELGAVHDGDKGPG